MVSPIIKRLSVNIIIPDIRFLNNSNQDLLTLVASTREATFAGNITAKVGNFQAPDATASIINQFADSNGNNCATFRTTTPGQIFEIRSQNSGTLKFDSTSSTFTGNVTINSNLTINGPSTKFNTDGDSFFEIADAGTNACYLRAGAGDEIYIGANNGYQLRLKTNKDVVTEWLLGKQKLDLLSKDGSKRTGKMYARGNRGAEAKEVNGALHIVAPLREYLLRPQKPPKR